MFAPNSVEGGVMVETLCECVREYAAVSRSSSNSPTTTRLRASTATDDHLSIRFST
jgi:hypothetical protein